MWILAPTSWKSGESHQWSVAPLDLNWSANHLIDPSELISVRRSSWPHHIDDDYTSTRLPIVCHWLHLQLIAARCDRYQNRKETGSLTKPSRFCACNKIKGVFNVMMALDDLQVCPRRTQSAYIRSYSSRVVWNCLTCVSKFNSKRSMGMQIAWRSCVRITKDLFGWLDVAIGHRFSLLLSLDDGIQGYETAGQWHVSKSVLFCVLKKNF